MITGLASVIIPAYNQAHYLAQAVESALSQTYPQVEVVIVDDGSTDNTREVAQSFTDPRVGYHYQPNAGLSAARNTGIRLSHGELITFLDSDDLFLPHKLKILTDAMQNDLSVGFAAGQAIYIDQNGTDLNKLAGTKLPDDPARLLLGNPLHVGSVLVKREWLDRTDPFDETLRACEDWDMWLRLALVGCPMIYVEQPVALYRIHAEQMTRGADRMRTAMLAMLDKTFNRADLPPEWLALKNQAYAFALIKSAARAYHAHTYDQAKNDLAEAVSLVPALLENEAFLLKTHLDGWAFAPMSDDPLGFLKNVYYNLPDTLPILWHQQNKHLAQVAIQLVFEAAQQGNMQTARTLIWQVARYQPQQLTNRGVLSILVRSYLPPRRQIH